jgi:hypothetical protein
MAQIFMDNGRSMVPCGKACMVVRLISPENQGSVLMKLQVGMDC